VTASYLFLLCWRTAGVVCPDRAGGFHFLYCARALLCFSPSWASIFSLSGQRKGTKRKATLPCWPTASLCASAYSGRCGTRCAQTVLALIRSKPAVLDNTKGKGKIKDNIKTGSVVPELFITSPLTTYRYAGVGRYSA